LLTPAGDLVLSVVADGAGLAAGDPGPDAKAAAGTTTAAAIRTAAKAARRYRTGMMCFMPAVLRRGG
jgi:hypothetical protein